MNIQVQSQLSAKTQRENWRGCCN